MASEQPDVFTLADAVTPWTIRVAATLRIADLIAGGATSLADLAEKSGADPGTLRRLMRYLTCRGVFAQTAEDEYAMTDSAALLLEDHPAGRRVWWDLNGTAGRIEASFTQLLHSVKTGEPAYAQVYGLSFYEDLAANPERAASFNALMATHASYFGLAAGSYDWTGASHVVDVGGGTGALLAAILTANPGLRGTLVDLPDVVTGAGARFAEAGLSDRVTTVGASLFDSLPAGGDVYVLSNVLHDWNDAAAARILARCAEAVRPGGRVLIIQQLVPEQEAGGPAPDPTELQWITQMDLRLLALLGGQERTLREYADLAAGAGLTLRGSTRIESGQALIELGRG